MQRRWKDAPAFALIVVVLVSTILLTITGASLLFSRLDLKVAANHKLGIKALELADGGAQHALSLVPAGVDFDGLLGTTIVNTTSFSSVPGFTYSVVVENDAADDGGASDDTNGIAVLASTALGPYSTRKVVKAHIRRSIPRGAIYLPGEADKVDTQLAGNATVNGNDTNIDGNSGPQSSVPGIATTSDATTAEISPAKPYLITGAGPTPSVMTSSKVDVGGIAAGLSAMPHITLAWGGDGSSFTTVSDVPAGALGTLAAPQITVITGNVHFSGGPPDNCTPSDSANCEGQNFGAGVLIVQGDLKTSGNFTFAGLVIVLGGTVSANPHVDMSGISYIHGMLMLKESAVDDGSSERELKITGNGTVKYSSQSLQMVNNNWADALPAKIVGWKDDF